jgi:hypothetical protein
VVFYKFLFQYDLFHNTSTRTVKIIYGFVYENGRSLEHPPSPPWINLLAKSTCKLFKSEPLPLDCSSDDQNIQMCLEKRGRENCARRRSAGLIYTSAERCPTTKITITKHDATERENETTISKTIAAVCGKNNWKSKKGRLRYNVKIHTWARHTMQIRHRL